MVPLNDLALFVGAAFLMVITPGPNMIYLMSRSICQGWRAGVLSLFGVATGFLVHVFAAAVGLTAVFMAVPMAYDLLRWIGALYLLYLAWQAVKPSGKSPFEARQLPHDSPKKLFVMGFLTNALNPKVAVFYLSIFPQFISPQHGSVFSQSLELGFTQILVSFSVNFCLILSAARVSAWFAHNPHWLNTQRYLMGSVLAGLAVHLMTEQRKTA